MLQNACHYCTCPGLRPYRKVICCVRLGVEQPRKRLMPPTSCWSVSDSVHRPGAENRFAYPPNPLPGLEGYLRGIPSTLPTAGSQMLTRGSRKPGVESLDMASVS